MQEAFAYFFFLKESRNRFIYTLNTTNNKVHSLSHI